jgi:hypothetical protein
LVTARPAGKLTLAMFSVLILIVSLATLGQFVVFSWRARLVSVAAQPLSEEMQAAIGTAANALNPRDFDTVASLHQICPALKEANRELWLVRSYYHALRIVHRLCGEQAAALASWSDREMGTCARYMAVVMDLRLQRNQVCFSQLRSF